MKKLSLSMLVLLILAMVLPLAVAEDLSAAPSITISDVVVVSGIEQEPGAAPLAEDFALETNPQSEALLAILAELIEAAKTDPAAAYFGEEIAAALLEVMPELISIDAIKGDELNAISIANYLPENGALTIKLTTLADYPADTVIAVVVGVVIDGELVWTLVEAQIVDGLLCIKLPAELLTAANGSELIYAVLRAA